MQLETRNLGQIFGTSQVLRNICLEVRKGEVFVLIGPTGCGKTTLLRLIGLLDKPASGAVFFGGTDVTRSDNLRLQARRRLAMVCQKPALFSGSVFDNVAYGLKVRKEDRVLINNRVRYALETVGLGGYETRRARTLSGGEVQRVALARAMVLEPELLILDEPTANLDPLTAAAVEQLINGVMRASGTTVIMSTHDMLQGQRLADRMGIMMVGALEQVGPPQELFNVPRSREIASFVGMENILDGVIVSNEDGMVTIKTGGSLVEAVSDLHPGKSVHACVRPEDIVLSRLQGTTSARNRLSGRVLHITSFGPFARVDLDCGYRLVALITRKSAEEMDLRVGSRLFAAFKATAVHIIPSMQDLTRAGTGKRVSDREQ